jgi:hypothetical protein
LHSLGENLAAQRLSRRGASQNFSGQLKLRAKREGYKDRRSLDATPHGHNLRNVNRNSAAPAGDQAAIGENKRGVALMAAPAERSSWRSGEQPMADQIGDPLGVLHIGLATRRVTDLPGVADEDIARFMVRAIEVAA